MRRNEDQIMNHVVLFGDSIFDNARYVPNELPLIEQVRHILPDGWSATLLALDGAVTQDVLKQVVRMPADATHSVVSCGGNDALRVLPMLSEKAGSVQEVMLRFSRIRNEFMRNYRAMLMQIRKCCPRFAVCTVYDRIPGIEAEAVTALSMFNEIILREAFAAKSPVIDLRLLCEDPTDYSSLSSIEPSCRGAEKIAGSILRVLHTHDFSLHRSVVYT